MAPGSVAARWSHMAKAGIMAAIAGLSGQELAGVYNERPADS